MLGSHNMACPNDQFAVKAHRRRKMIQALYKLQPARSGKGDFPTKQF
jgi:hypothetical protein